MAINTFETRKSIMGRDEVLGIPQTWFVIMLFPLGLAMTTKVWWLLFFVLPMYMYARGKYKKDIYWLEIFSTSVGQADHYRA